MLVQSISTLFLHKKSPFYTQGSVDNERLFLTGSNVILMEIISNGGVVMKILSDEALLDVYQKSIALNLDKEFIELLLAEIHIRNLDIPQFKSA
jgi:hypothetical protein